MWTPLRRFHSNKMPGTRQTKLLQTWGTDLAVFSAARYGGKRLKKKKSNSGGRAAANHSQLTNPTTGKGKTARRCRFGEDFSLFPQRSNVKPIFQHHSVRSYVFFWWHGHLCMFFPPSHQADVGRHHGLC